MRLFRLGDSGPSVKDIQDRLVALGFEISTDNEGDFGEGTATATRAFQESRGLGPDGIVGPETWRALYEAGYRLGDRLLYLRRPMLRGEDVAELQQRLNNLGFDAGKPDGIFGPDTVAAVTKFQHDRNLAVDGVGGPATITELRLVTRSALGMGRETVREREWLRNLSSSPVGTRVCFDPAGRTPEESGLAWEAANAASLAFQDLGGIPIISRPADVSVPERVRAGRANRNGAELIVAFQLPTEGEPDLVFYFETPRSRSEGGALLARNIADLIGGEVVGRASAILRETRAPAVIVAHRGLSAQLGMKTVEGLQRFFEESGAN